MLAFPEQRLDFGDLARHIQPPGGLRAQDWVRHSNGGGWVQRTARVAPTAFVGPYAIVSGEAQVLDSARILDEACITGMARVFDEAIVAGRAHVGGQALVFGLARILGTADVGAQFTISEGELFSGAHRPLSRSPHCR